MQIKQTPGTIGYVEFGYALKIHLAMASLQNQAGKFVAPTPDTGSAALAKVDLPANLRAFVTDPSGDTSYPDRHVHSGGSATPSTPKPGVADAIKALANWSLTDGQKLAPDLGYLPASSRSRDQSAGRSQPDQMRCPRRRSPPAAGA